MKNKINTENYEIDIHTNGRALADKAGMILGRIIAEKTAPIVAGGPGR